MLFFHPSCYKDKISPFFNGRIIFHCDVKCFIFLSLSLPSFLLCKKTPSSLLELKTELRDSWLICHIFILFYFLIHLFIHRWTLRLIAHLAIVHGAVRNLGAMGVQPILQYTDFNSFGSTHSGSPPHKWSHQQRSRGALYCQVTCGWRFRMVMRHEKLYVQLHVTLKTFRLLNCIFSPACFSLRSVSFLR